MRDVFMVMAEEGSAVGALAPRYPDILRAWASAAAPPAMAWVGPAPRVTRVYDVVLGTITRVAQPIKVDDPSLDPAEAIEILTNRVRDALAGLSMVPGAWHAPSVVPYNERLNGQLAFWRSGDASRTRTFDTPPGVLNAGEVPDNPVGPNDPALRPPSAAETLADWWRRHSTAGVPTLVWVALGGLALIYLGPALGNLLERATKSTGGGTSTSPARRAPHRAAPT